VVLDGAVALAFPTKFGQSLTIETILEQKIFWKSIDDKGVVWFEDEFIINNHEIASSQTSRNDVSKRLANILNTAKKLNPDFLKTNSGYTIVSTLEFPQNWGLGSSSTLINNIANWAEVDPYELLELTFGGSGYDIACAQNDSAIIYQLQGKKPIVERLNFIPTFKEHLYFVHLNKKQNSRDGIAHYKSNRKNIDASIIDINRITDRMTACKTLSEFETLMEQHETIVSNIIQLEPIKKRLFNDFNGAIKSLGAWGGDFVLVASKDNPKHYFTTKGFNTILTYDEMILK
jgi:mevalonate kinase